MFLPHDQLPDQLFYIESQDVLPPVLREDGEVRVVLRIPATKNFADFQSNARVHKGPRRLLPFEAAVRFNTDVSGRSVVSRHGT